MRGRIAWLAALAGCYRAHVPASACGDDPPSCASQAEPCAARVAVAAECQGESWVCPAGSQGVPARWSEASCVPLAARVDAASAERMGEAPIPVPIDGVCHWVYPSADDARRIFATPMARDCASIAAPFALTVEAGSYDYLAFQAAFFDQAKRVRMLARAWSFDDQQVYGVRSDGVGFGVLQAHAVSLATPLAFGDDLDLGDAALVDGDFVYAYGCPGTPQQLEEDCIVGRAPLARLDESSAWSVWGAQGWGNGAPARVFGSGPHRGAVFSDPRGGFAHLFAVGFGSTIQLTQAARPEGPWSKGVELVACALPKADAHAYCAGPVVYLELYDPSEPDEWVIGYSIGTTAEDGASLRAARPLDYAPRIVRVKAPR